MNQHSRNCDKYRYSFACMCTCGASSTYLDRSSVDIKIDNRIKEIQDEIDSGYRMIGQAYVGGDTALAEVWAVGIREKEARIHELKNVLSMLSA